MSKKEFDRLDIIQQLDKKIINKQKEAAKLLDLSTRQVRRLVKEYRRTGSTAFLHALRGKAGNHHLPSGLKEEALRLVKEKYADFAPTLASEELLKREGLNIHPATLRLAMIDNGLWAVKARKARHRKWRERKECFGEMVQFDGSDHGWFEDRGPKCVLLCSRDDATNETFAVFAKAEDLMEVLGFWKQYIAKYGKPKSVYLDRHSIYKTSRPLQNQGEESTTTQFERAMEESSIAVIHAYSPQAKGRAENVFGTLQDRLVKELRLEGIQNIAEANRFLKDKFLPEFNGKFRLEAKEKTNLHRKPTEDLDTILCKKERRYIGNDFTIRYQNRWYQLDDLQPTLVTPGQKVIVETRLDGQIRLNLNDKYLAHSITNQRPLRERKAYALTSSPRPPRVYAKPTLGHPWRKFTINRQKQKEDISILIKSGHF